MKNMHQPNKECEIYQCLMTSVVNFLNNLFDR